jgi:hypothetical protein
METNKSNDDNRPHTSLDGPEPGATDEAVALHGDKAASEKHDQPEAVTLDGSTRIATGEPEDGNDAAPAADSRTSRGVQETRDNR